MYIILGNVGASLIAVAMVVTSAHGTDLCAAHVDDVALRV